MSDRGPFGVRTRDTEAPTLSSTPPADPILTPEQVAAIYNYEVYNGPESIHKTQKLTLCDSHEALREQVDHYAKMVIQLIAESIPHGTRTLRNWERGEAMDKLILDALEHIAMMMSNPNDGWATADIKVLHEKVRQCRDRWTRDNTIP